MLELSSVGYTYAGTSEPALRDINLRVLPGQLLGIAGANGSGKSTLARLMNGLLLPTTGHVRLEGRPTQTAAALWALKTRVGLVFQNPDNQFIGATVEDDVAFGPENFGVPPDEIERRIEEVLRLVGLEHKRDHLPASLSGGQKQLVSLAAVLAQKPACIVFDECTAMLDPGDSRLVVDTIARLVDAEGLAAVVISHDVGHFLLADEVVALDRGRIAFHGSPAQLWRDRDRLERLGLEPPDAVRLRDELRNAGIDVAAECASVDELVDALCQLS